jgi:hypothetical protein
MPLTKFFLIIVDLDAAVRFLFREAKLKLGDENNASDGYGQSYSRI